jgi:hypothetical protein
MINASLAEAKRFRYHLHDPVISSLLRKIRAPLVDINICGWLARKVCREVVPDVIAPNTNKLRRSLSMWNLSVSGWSVVLYSAALELTKGQNRTFLRKIETAVKINDLFLLDSRTSPT